MEYWECTRGRHDLYSIICPQKICPQIYGHKKLGTIFVPFYLYHIFLVQIKWYKPCTTCDRYKSWKRIPGFCGCCINLEGLSTLRRYRLRVFVFRGPDLLLTNFYRVTHQYNNCPVRMKFPLPWGLPYASMELLYPSGCVPFFLCRFYEKGVAISAFYWIFGQSFESLK